MMKLSAQDGRQTVNETLSSNSNSHLTYAAETFLKVIDDYRKSPTPYRRALIDKHGSKPYLHYSEADCLDAIEREMAIEDGHVAEGKRRATPKAIVKRAIWRLVNLAESNVVFNMFKNDVNKALQHIREQFRAEYNRTAKYARERYGFDLTIQDYCTNIWLHLSAGMTWKAFDTYRGDSSVYAWLKKVCQHCITDYIESSGYAPLYTSADNNDEDDDIWSFADESTVSRSSKITIRLEDYDGIQIADSRSSYDADFVTDDPNFLFDRIQEMPWEEWKKDFAIDSVIREASVADLTEKYGTLVAEMSGRSMPFDRTWTDNRNSRLKHDLYDYAIAFMHNDREVLRDYAKKQRSLDRQHDKADARKTA